jgi:DNA helicase-2/ATP-dependent DNA helicase PcrA
VPVIGKSPEDDEERADGDAYLDIINYARSKFLIPEEIYDFSTRPGTRAEFNMFTRAYSDWKDTYGFYDFTDMLARVAAKSTKFDAEIIFVDEAQDLSPLQWKVIERFSKSANEVIIAGDDDQAIYSWSGADPHGMARFTEKYSGGVEILAQSHRLPSSVHEKSQALIRRIVTRVDKEFNPRPDVGSVVLHGSFNSVQFGPQEDILLLGRTHSVLREIENDLINRRVPYLRESGRPGMYQNKYAKGIQAFHKLKSGESLLDSERSNIFNVATPETKALLERNEYNIIVKRPFYVALDIPFRVVDFYRDADLSVVPTIRLSTIHASKGHEADRVILLTDMTQRVAETAEKYPDDEIRVFYVGVTRAKHQLDIVEGHNGFNI